VILPHLSGIHEIDVHDMRDTPTGHVGHRPEPRAVQQSPTAWLPEENDLFHPKVPTGFIEAAFDVMVRAPQHSFQVLTKRPKRAVALANKLPWPSNIWLGVSVEDQPRAWRVDDLRRVPAAVRFLSVEPLLGSVDLDLTGISWVIVGGESGPGARPMDPKWARNVRDACRRSDVPFFFKQWGGRTPKAGGRQLDGETWDEFPVAAAALG
jgi:protein gp37